MKICSFHFLFVPLHRTLNKTTIIMTTITVDEKVFWSDQPVAEGYVTIRYFFKWLIGKDLWSSRCPDEVYDEILSRGFRRWFSDAQELKEFIKGKFAERWRIRVFSFKNEGNTEFPYKLMILGLSKWSFETPHEKRFDCDGILSKKKLKKNGII